MNSPHPHNRRRPRLPFAARAAALLTAAALLCTTVAPADLAEGVAHRLRQGAQDAAASCLAPPMQASQHIMPAPPAQQNETPDPTTATMGRNTGITTILALNIAAVILSAVGIAFINTAVLRIILAGLGACAVILLALTFIVSSDARSFAAASFAAVRSGIPRTGAAIPSTISASFSARVFKELPRRAMGFISALSLAGAVVAVIGSLASNGILQGAGALMLVIAAGIAGETVIKAAFAATRTMVLSSLPTASGEDMTRSFSIDTREHKGSLPGVLWRVIKESPRDRNAASFKKSLAGLAILFGIVAAGYFIPLPGASIEGFFATLAGGRGALSIATLGLQPYMLAGLLFPLLLKLPFLKGEKKNQSYQRIMKRNLGILLAVGIGLAQFFFKMQPNGLLTSGTVWLLRPFAVSASMTSVLPWLSLVLMIAFSIAVVIAADRLEYKFNLENGGQYLFLAPYIALIPQFISFAGGNATGMVLGVAAAYFAVRILKTIYAARLSESGLYDGSGAATAMVRAANGLAPAGHELKESINPAMSGLLGLVIGTMLAGVLSAPFGASTLAGGAVYWIVSAVAAVVSTRLYMKAMHDELMKPFDRIIDEKIVIEGAVTPDGVKAFTKPLYAHAALLYGISLAVMLIAQGAAVMLGGANPLLMTAMTALPLLIGSSYALYYEAASRLGNGRIKTLDGNVYNPAPAADPAETTAQDALIEQAAQYLLSAS